MTELLFFSGFVLSYISSWYLPRWYVFRFRREQRSIITPCNAYYTEAINALELGDVHQARDLAARIRNRERIWNLGNSRGVSFAVWLTAVCLGIIGFMLVRASLMAAGASASRREPFAKLFLELVELDFVLLFFLFMATLHALVGVTTVEWVERWQRSDLAGSLERLINSPRGLVGVPSDPQDQFDPDLTAEELFGLPEWFTRRDVDLARRRLAKALHPDRWFGAAPNVIAAKELAMKRVNQAYEELLRKCL